MLTLDQLRKLAKANVAHYDPAARERVLSEIGNPSGEEQAEAAASHLDDEDRNVRVAMLRVLAFAEGEHAIQGILRGLEDPVRRVREVAAKSAPRFLDDERIVNRLRRAVEEDERGSRGPALEILVGRYHSPYGINSWTLVPEAVADWAANERIRSKMLLGLLRSPMTDELRSILQDVVRQGSKEEAVLATRRLCGFRVDRQELIDPETMRTAEPAFGRVWYWIRDPV